MLNRRDFTMGIGSAVIAGAAHAIGVDDDEAIRYIRRRRVEIEKRNLGMAVCEVTVSHQRQSFSRRCRFQVGRVQPSAPHLHIS